MDRKDMPLKAFASVQGESRLFQHHTDDVRDGAAHATVDLDRLEACIEIARQMGDKVPQEALAHILYHVREIVGDRAAYANIPEAGNNGSAFPLFEMLRREQRLKHFEANLSTQQEQPPIFGPGHGRARFLLNERTRELFYSIESFELSTRETAAHIHVGDSKTPTAEAEIAIPLPVGRIKEGSVTLTDEQMQALVQGRYLVNIHTAEYPLGEIRGQIFPVDLSLNREGQPREERPLTGNPSIDRAELPEEGDGAPTAPGVNAGEMQSPINGDPKPKAPAQKSGPGQEEMDPDADESASPAAEPGKLESGQEDMDPKPLTDERPQTEPGDPETGGGGPGGDSKEEDGQEKDTPKADRDSSKVAPKEPGSVEGQKKKSKSQDEEDKDEEEMDDEEGPDEEEKAEGSEIETFGEILDSVSATTKSIGKRLRRRNAERTVAGLGKLTASELAASVIADNEETLLERGEAKPTVRTRANLTDPNNSVLKLELSLLNTPEKLRNFATPTAEQQENRENTILTASFVEVEGRVVKMDGDFQDLVVGPKAFELLPDRVDSVFSPDGRFLGMKARIVDTRKLSQTETIALVMEPDDSEEGEGPSFGLFMDVLRDSEGTVRELRMLDTFVPAVFLKDFATFLEKLQ